LSNFVIKPHWGIGPRATIFLFYTPQRKRSSNDYWFLKDMKTWGRENAPVEATLIVERFRIRRGKSGGVVAMYVLIERKNRRSKI